MRRWYSKSVIPICNILSFHSVTVSPECNLSEGWLPNESLIDSNWSFLRMSKQRERGALGFIIQDLMPCYSNDLTRQLNKEHTATNVSTLHWTRNGQAQSGQIQPTASLHHCCLFWQQIRTFHITRLYRLFLPWRCWILVSDWLEGQSRVCT